MTKTRRRDPLPFLGLACGVSVSAIYFNQPLLVDIGRSFGATGGHTGYIAVATQVGYALGMLAFVPLGDLMERRRLMMRMYAAVGLSLLIAAFSPNLSWMIAASVLVGLTACVTHIVLPIAPDLVDEDQRGRAIGVVMTGLLLGVLLGRTFSGWVSKIPIGHLAGWRTVFVVGAVACFAFVPMIRRLMPELPPKQRMTYGSAIYSLWTLWRRHRLLRESAIVGALFFASFTCFWTMLALMLDSRYGLGAGIAGTFGMVGAAGAIIAPWAGRTADRRGPRYLMSYALAVMAGSYVFLWAQDKLHVPVLGHIVIMFACVISLDMGTQMAQIANQTRIFGLDTGARSRLNTIYMMVYFIGAAVGSAGVTVAWMHWQWNGVCVLALLLIGIAVLVHAFGQKGWVTPAQVPVAEERVLEI